jgi:hypothetical protein
VASEILRNQTFCFRAVINFIKSAWVQGTPTQLSMLTPGCLIKIKLVHGATWGAAYDHLKSVLNASLLWFRCEHTALSIQWLSTLVENLEVFSETFQHLVGRRWNEHGVAGASAAHSILRAAEFAGFFLAAASFRQQDAVDFLQ